MNDATAVAEPKAATAQRQNIIYRFNLQGYQVDAHGEKLAVLEFREPMGADIVRYGNPVRVGNEEFTIDPVAMEAIMSGLAVVPPSAIKQLKAQDWSTIAFHLFYNFFVPRVGERASSD